MAEGSKESREALAIFEGIDTNQNGVVELCELKAYTCRGKKNVMRPRAFSADIAVLWGTVWVLGEW